MKEGAWWERGQRLVRGEREGKGKGRGVRGGEVRTVREKVYEARDAEGEEKERERGEKKKTPLKETGGVG